MTRYVVNKYAGKKYCGNAFFNTIDDCIAFADDGFCTRAKIRDTETGRLLTVKIEHDDTYFD